MFDDDQVERPSAALSSGGSSRPRSWSTAGEPPAVAIVDRHLRTFAARLSGRSLRTFRGTVRASLSEVAAASSLSCCSRSLRLLFRAAGTTRARRSTRWRRRSAPSGGRTQRLAPRTSLASSGGMARQAGRCRYTLPLRTSPSSRSGTAVRATPSTVAAGARRCTARPATTTRSRGPAAAPRRPDGPSTARPGTQPPPHPPTAPPRRLSSPGRQSPSQVAVLSRALHAPTSTPRLRGSWASRRLRPLERAAEARRRTTILWMPLRLPKPGSREETAFTRTNWKATKGAGRATQQKTRRPRLSLSRRRTELASLAFSCRAGTPKAAATRAQRRGRRRNLRQFRRSGTKGTSPGGGGRLCSSAARTCSARPPPAASGCRWRWRRPRRRRWTRLSRLWSRRWLRAAPAPATLRRRRRRRGRGAMTAFHNRRLP